MKALKRFKDNELQVLVVTDIERGRERRCQRRLGL
jgi:hypothetical protein